MRLTRLAGGIGLAIGYGFLAVIPPASANNIIVTNMTLVNQDSSGMLDVKFDLRWDNSWRIADPACTNWDAAWVFVKFWGSNGSQHATLGTANGQHHPAPNSTIDAVPDGKGVFVYRSGAYTGAVDYAGTRVRWNYAADGYNFYAGAAVTVSVHAVEMVYVPQGPFWAGRAGGDNYYSFRSQSDANAPISITNADAFTIYWGGSGTSTSVPAAFPNGYDAFYCMKYELTQWQYMSFLNELARAQQNNRTASQAATNFAMSAQSTPWYRNGIRCPGAIPGSPTNIVFGCDGDSDMTFNETNDGQNYACNYLSWGDGIAYADWAGLRPMTELEYEKACRGPLAPPWQDEYAWGDNQVVHIAGESGTPGSGTEACSTPQANSSYNYNSGFFPTRVGVFATVNSTRKEAGATYWGIMEMSGNVSERCVTVGHAIGLAFTGLHGDGQLNAFGDADSFAMMWPLSDGVGAGFRGVAWGGYDSNFIKIANRWGATTVDGTRGIDRGWRGVRTAP